MHLHAHRHIRQGHLFGVFVKQDAADILGCALSCGLYRLAVEICSTLATVYSGICVR